MGGQAFQSPFSNSMSKLRKKNGVPPVIERKRGDFLDSRLIICSSGRLEPWRDREIRVGISSARCVTSAGAKSSISLVRCVPENTAGSEMQVFR